MLSELHEKAGTLAHQSMYLLFLLPLVLSQLTMYWANRTENYDPFGWGLAAMVLFMGIVDHLIGKAPFSPSGGKPVKNTGRFYTVLLYMSIPAASLISVQGALIVSNVDDLSLLGGIGWVISIGMAVSWQVLAAGHELLHRGSRLNRLTGGFVFAFLCISAQKIDHIRGHHRNVATPLDPGSAAFNQSFYRYFPPSLVHTMKNAWAIEKERLRRKGKEALDWHNELIAWNIATLSFAGMYLFFFGLPGLLFFIGQGAVAVTFHHIITYIQHYGLRRHKLLNGRYEGFAVAHAWSCNFLISNMVAFKNPIHTDHHLHPMRPYPCLQHNRESPQMPTGYFGMFMLSLIPPLWFRVMNPRVLAYNGGTFKESVAANEHTL